MDQHRTPRAGRAYRTEVAGTLGLVAGIVVGIGLGWGSPDAAVILAALCGAAGGGAGLLLVTAAEGVHFVLTHPAEPRPLPPDGLKADYGELTRPLCPPPDGLPPPAPGAGHGCCTR